MKKMKLSKRIACFILAAFMAVPAASAMNLPEASTVEAASTKNVTMYVGESVDIGLSKYVKKLKSSNKKIVKTGTYTDSINSKWSYITAKKKGTSTVSYKKSGYTYKYKITVKKANIKASATNVGYGDFVVKIKNNTNQYFENLKVKYTVKNASGDVLAEDTVLAYDLAAKGESYKTIYTGLTSSQIAEGVTCSVKVTPYFHDFTVKYVNASKKVKITKEALDSTGEYLNISYKNNNSKTVSGSIYVVFYDASENIVDMGYRSIYLKKNQTKTEKIYVPSDYASYKIVKDCYYNK